MLVIPSKPQTDAEYTVAMIEQYECLIVSIEEHDLESAKEWLRAAIRKLRENLHKNKS